MLIRRVLRPGFLGLLLTLGALAWHYRPIEGETLIPVEFSNGKHGYINADGRAALTPWRGLGQCRVFRFRRL